MGVPSALDGGEEGEVAECGFGLWASPFGRLETELADPLRPTGRAVGLELPLHGL